MSSLGLGIMGDRGGMERVSEVCLLNILDENRTVEHAGIVLRRQGDE
jgi:hypothetical protein